MQTPPSYPPQQEAAATASDEVASPQPPIMLPLAAAACALAPPMQLLQVLLMKLKVQETLLQRPYLTSPMATSHQACQIPFVEPAPC
jgi:hypothetical protein